jgi:hypothetical protein
MSWTDSIALIVTTLMAVLTGPPRVSTTLGSRGGSSANHISFCVPEDVAVVVFHTCPRR